ncbi:hypothetical protein [Fuchsiella alkaliacetigena]|uniref:hypothetical protein n=1 Tax=Fuchsiella alkaliacetigena TaxID=957042 RepID=UPI002009EE27|nr:hypothetical protein [Fuchsiella alkaliacetigena]MCK8825549.1 hypothetical protein [Fuchsiella alkaliacetigena]
MIKNKNYIVVSVLVFLFLTASTLSQEAWANNKVLLEEGTTVKLETVEELNSDNISSFYLSSGNQVRFRVIEDVEVDDNVVIEAGEIAFGDIVNVESTSNPLRIGGLNIKVKSVESVDGTKINLTGGELIESRVRKRRIPLTSFPPLLLLTSSDATIPENTGIKAEVIGINKINID